MAQDHSRDALSPAADVDRYNHRRLMLGCEPVQRALMVVVAVWLPALPVLMALVALRAVAGQLFQAASR